MALSSTSRDEGAMMESPLLSSPLAYDIREVVRGIFENMLHLSLTAECRPSDISGECVVATLDFSGSWAGRVSLRCEMDQARRLAARFLELPVEELPDRLVADVLGEIVNMIAGNLKSVFATDIRLALAHVTPGSSETGLSFVPAIKQEAFFASTEGPFQVSVAATAGQQREAWPR
jgi:chemotaxis protein CheX